MVFGLLYVLLVSLCYLSDVYVGKSDINPTESSPSHPLSPQHVFLRQILSQMQRLSYYERIKSVLPETFQSLITETGPVYRYSDAEACGDEGLWAVAVEV